MTVSSTVAQATSNRPTTSGKTLLGLQLLIVAVFFLFGGIGNLNDVLIPKLKGLFQLNYAQAMLVQFAFLTSYAIFSIPAGMLLNRLGYLRGLVLGFAIMAVACLLFLPAAWSGLYGSFLAALFVLGAGITLLQVAVNPLIILLGDPATAHSRLTFAQLFNSLGVFIMIRFGAHLILSEQNTIDPTTLSGTALDAHRIAETSIIGEAYIGLAIVLALIAAFFWLWRGVLDKEQVTKVQFRGIFDLLHRTRLAFGCLCIFLYVGAEVSIASLMINYLGDARTLSRSAIGGRNALLLLARCIDRPYVRRIPAASGAARTTAGPGRRKCPIASADIVTHQRSCRSMELDRGGASQFNNVPDDLQSGDRGDGR